MKREKDPIHIFIVHNFITYILCKSIIDFHKINDNNYLILSFRNFSKVKVELKSIPYPFSDYDSTDLHPSYNFIKSWKNLFIFDNTVKRITSNRKFKLYLLGFANIRSFYAFSSHKNCIGYSFVEEGAISFNSFDFFDDNYVIKYSKKYKLLNIINFGGRINGNIFKFYYPDYDSVYCISQDAFVDWKNKITLPISKSFKNMKTPFSQNHIFVLEGLVLAGFGTNYDYLKLLSIFSEYCENNNIKEVLYKHHPSTKNEEEIDGFLCKFANVKFIKLPNSTSLETLALSSTNLNFYGTRSSILLYANIFGAKAYSLSFVYETIMGKKFPSPPPYFNKIENISI